MVFIWVPSSPSGLLSMGLLRNWANFCGDLVEIAYPSLANHCRKYYLSILGIFGSQRIISTLSFTKY